jgi:hypothetical protein
MWEGAARLDALSWSTRWFARNSSLMASNLGKVSGGCNCTIKEEGPGMELAFAFCSLLGSRRRL